jgi:hypothetical protein
MRSPRLWWLGFLGLMAEASIAAERLPVFDAHIHYNADAAETLSVAEAIGILERAGVSRALVSSTPNDGTLALYRAAPERIVPLLRPYRTAADRGRWHEDEAVRRYLEREFERGIWRGIGEFHLHGEQAGGAVVARVVALVVERDLALHAHADEEAVERLFAHDPRVKVLWAHGRDDRRARGGRAAACAPRDAVGGTVVAHARGRPGRTPGAGMARALSALSRPVPARHRHLDRGPLGKRGERGGRRAPLAAGASARDCRGDRVS